MTLKTINELTDAIKHNENYEKIDFDVVIDIERDFETDYETLTCHLNGDQVFERSSLRGAFLLAASTVMTISKLKRVTTNIYVH